MSDHAWPQPDDHRDLFDPRRGDQALPWTQPPTLATGLPEWDLLPPTEFVHRPRGLL
jgi:hypothetical protein